MADLRRGIDPTGLYYLLGLRPTTRQLRRNSPAIVAVFLRGYSHAQIAHAMAVDVALIEDAIRWHMKREKRVDG